jgi:hypothetical protein
MKNLLTVVIALLIVGVFAFVGWKPIKAIADGKPIRLSISTSIDDPAWVVVSNHRGRHEVWACFSRVGPNGRAIVPVCDLARMDRMLMEEYLRRAQD